MYCILNNFYCVMISLSSNTDGLLVLRRHPQDQFVTNSDKVVFKYFANGSDSIDITWLKNSSSLRKGSIMTSDHGSTLTINRARVADSGKYPCRATNADGDSTTSNEAELISNVHFFFTCYIFIYSTTTDPHQLQ